MHISHQLTILDEILEQYRTVIGKDFDGYRNHCYRVYQFFIALSGGEIDDNLNQKLQIALAFHDLGLFTDHTVDYLPPSMQLAKNYLQAKNLTDWQDEILLMIEQHHKITAFDSTVYPNVELLRQADLVDFSLGNIRFGLDKTFVKSVRQKFANAGFHKMVAVRQIGWLKQHPKNPFPIFKL